MSRLDAFKKGELLKEEDVFTSFDEAPIDTLLFEDGDNSLLANSPGGIMTQAYRLPMSSTSIVQRRIVPYTRLLKYSVPYMRGKDVFAVSRALAHAGCRKWGNFTYFYGAGMKKNMMKFQKLKGLPQTGRYDLETHKKLARYFDAYGTKLMIDMKEKLNPSTREVIMSYAMHGYNNRHKIHYTQGPLRMYGVKHKVKLPNVPSYEDCSSYSTWCYWGANAPDPNGLNYNGFGYTGTLASNGVRTTNPKVGDLAFYGRFPYGHVTIYIGNGRCVSHGSEGGPYLLPVRYRGDLSHYRTYNLKKG